MLPCLECIYYQTFSFKELLRIPKCTLPKLFDLFKYYHKIPISCPAISGTIHMEKTNDRR
jgi:hypothetical protein